MELLAFDYECISGLAADDHDDDLGVLLIHIVKNSKIAEPKLVCCQGIGSKEFDGATRRSRLVSETRGNPVADDPLLPGR
jgi:hypothetical protein